VSPMARSGRFRGRPSRETIWHPGEPRGRNTQHKDIDSRTGIKIQSLLSAFRHGSLFAHRNYIGPKLPVRDDRRHRHECAVLQTRARLWTCAVRNKAGRSALGRHTVEAIARSWTIEKLSSRRPDEFPDRHQHLTTAAIIDRFFPN